MASITLRSVKGSALTNAEVDANFSNLNTELGDKLASALLGAVNGVASLDSSGLVPSTQLPSYVDDVLEYANLAALPGTGATGKIYVTLDTNKTYRWSGSTYIELAGSPGSTDSVAEGSVNLYFTNARARSAISVSGSLSYNSTTGVISYTAPTNVSTFTNDSGYITSSALSGYLTSATAASTYLPLSGGTLTGDLAFSGTGLKITGDFTNGTVASRAYFQTSTTNGNTFITAVPNGTAVNAQFQAYNSSDPANASIAALVASSSQVRIVSGFTGTGTLHPITFIFSNTEAARFDATTRNFLIGTSTDNGTDKLQVNGTVSATGFTGNASTASKWATARTASLSGDVTGSASVDGSANWSIAATLANSGVSAGTYGDATNIPQIAVDAKGRITSVSNVAVSIPSGSLTFTGDVTGTGSTGSSTALTLANSGVSAGTYKSVTVDAKGRVTAGTNPTTLSGYGITDALALAGGTMTGGLTLKQSSVSASTAATTLDFATGNQFLVTLSSSTTFTFSNLAAGQQGVIYLKQDATGGRTITLPAVAKTPNGGAAISQVTTANSTSILSYTVLDTSNVLVNYIGNFA